MTEPRSAATGFPNPEMNKYIEAIKVVDLGAVEAMLQEKPKWIEWAEPSGKNALHFLCGLGPSDDPGKTKDSLAMLKLLLKSGMDINSIHRIEDKNCDFFPATPLWYAYTRGRNETLYKYLLKNGADTRNCWWAIAWYDDVVAAKLWLKHGAEITEKPTLNELFLGSFQWKKYNFVSWLHEMGAEVNAVDHVGNTALMMAVKRKDDDRIKWLVERGADPDRANKQGISARMIAEQKGPRRLLQLL
jgi:ankyrin repeat protein